MGRSGPSARESSPREVGRTVAGGVEADPIRRLAAVPDARRGITLLPSCGCGPFHYSNRRIRTSRRRNARKKSEGMQSPAPRLILHMAREHPLAEGSIMQQHAGCLVSLFFAHMVAFADEPAWRYVAKPETDSPIRPVFRFVTLSSTKPDDLGEEVQYRGKQQKYAQIRYGSEESRRVVVVVDEVSPDDF